VQSVRKNLCKCVQLCALCKSYIGTQERRKIRPGANIITAKPIFLVCNPAAGRRKGAFIGRIVAEIEARGAVVNQLITQHAGHGESLAAELAKSGAAKLVVAVGGDGTIREVAAGLYGRDTRLGLIPAGTANVLAREVGYLKSGATFGRATVNRIADILLGNTSSPLYPFQVEQGGETRLGFCWLSAGFDAEVLARVDAVWKKRLGRAAFAPAMVKALVLEAKNTAFNWRIDAPHAALPNIEPPHIEPALNGLVQQGTCGRAVIANIQRYGGPFMLTKATEISAQGLACLMFEKQGMAARLAEQCKMLFTPLDKAGAARVLEVGSVTLGSKTTAIQLDGDFAGYGPAKITPLNKAIEVMSPPPDA